MAANLPALGSCRCGRAMPIGPASILRMDEALQPPERLSTGSDHRFTTSKSHLSKTYIYPFSRQKLKVKRPNLPRVVSKGLVTTLIHRDFP